MKKQPLLEASKLSKKYGARTVVSEVSLQVGAGDIVAIIGPNGAGKSTTIDMLLGLRQPDEGSINYWHRDYLAQVGVQLQSTPFFPGLNCIQNLRLFAAFYRKKLDDAAAGKLLALCGLSEAARIEASRLSGGQQKRLAIAIATVHNPILVFLDEPTAALDPRARQEIHDVISKFAAAGTAILFTSHDMDEVHKLAHRVMMIDKGVVIAEGAPDQLCEYYDVNHLNEVYLKLTEKGMAV